MRIALVDASPKPSGSCSGRLLEVVRLALDGRAEAVLAAMHGAKVPAEARQALGQSDAWVLSYPLYVDGLPAPLVSCLLELADAPGAFGRKTAYAISNCGFYEGRQTDASLRMVRNWAVRAGISFGGGLGLGGGPALGIMLATLPPVKWSKGPLRPSVEALRRMADDIVAGREFGFHFVDAGMPRGIYKLAGQYSFRAMAKKNGLKARDIGARAEE